MMKTAYTILAAALLLVLAAPAGAQNERRNVRAGNRMFAKEDYRAAAVKYGTSVAEDTTSFAAQYNLASTLYRLQDFQGAGQALSAIKESVPREGTRAAARKDTGREGDVCDAMADYYYNAGDVALQAKDYQSAVDAFKQALLRNPADLDAKENYIYAKEMLKNQQNGGGGGQDQNQDQDQQDQNDDQQNQDQQDQQDQNQNQDQQDQDQNQDQQEQQAPQPKISQQQAQQMLKAIQEAEKKTQDKVNEEKAAQLQSRQKEKNW